MANSKDTRADPIRCKLPTRLAHLEAFVQVARSSKSYDDFLLASILSCCFYACHRSSELIWNNAKDEWDWCKVIKRGSLSFGHNRASYHLPYHKADRFHRGTNILLTAQGVACPVALLREYVALRDNAHGARATLFFLRESGDFPTRSWFDSKFSALLDRPFGGHSLRAGGATFYASLGLSEDIIQTPGRWSSESWKLYICDNPTIRVELQLH